MINPAGSGSVLPTREARPDDEELVRQAYPRNAAGAPVCYVCGAPRKRVDDALCLRCWRERTVFWRHAYYQLDPRGRAELVLTLDRVERRDLRDQVLEALAGGPRTARAIADTLGVPGRTGSLAVAQVLSRLRAEGLARIANGASISVWERIG